MERKYINLRVILVLMFFGALFSVIGFRVVQLQVLKSEWLSAKASRQYDRSITNQDKRGTIYDTNMNILASSVSVTSIAIRPKLIEADLKPQMALTLAGALNMDVQEVAKKLNQENSFVWLKRKLNPQQADVVKAMGFKGLEFLKEYERYYPNKTLAAQAVGFTSVDGKGLEGIEFYCNEFLTPNSNSVSVIRDAHGNILRNITPDVITEATGHNVVLTLDLNIQYLTEQVLVETVEKFQAKSAMAVVMNPYTGEILALAQAPLFNPNSLNNSERGNWRNRIVADKYEAGSVMKIFSAAAALETGLITADTQYYCENGAYKIGRNTVRDTKKLGTLSVRDIIKVSSNIGVIKMTEQVGRDVLYTGLRNFGFGEKTGIECPGETAGYLSQPGAWSRIDAAAISFGHGLSVTPIQIATAAGAIANGGLLMKPYIIKSVVDDNGEVVRAFSPVVRQRAISTQTAVTMNLILQSVTDKGGTGVSAAINGYAVAGKTGTANKPDVGGYSRSRYMSSFVGFAPADNPAVVVLVMVDEPMNGYYAASVAAPAFNKIMQKTLYYLHVAPRQGFDGEMQVAKKEK